MGHLETGSAGLTIHKPPLLMTEFIMKVCDFMSKWSEALELAKAGFKASEIKEMWEAKDETPTEQEVEEKEEEQEEKEEEMEEQKEEPIDYKLKYEEAMEKLKIAQKENSKKDISENDDQKTIEEKGYEILADIWR